MLRARKWLPNYGLAIFSLLLVLAVIEIALRIAGYNPFKDILDKDSRAIFIQPSSNPQRIYEAKPLASGYGWETQISINRHGFRGRDYTLEKPPGTFRIVVIGDSITFGNRLAPEENFPAVLESLYQKAGKKVEVLNLGLGGYDTLQEVAALQDLGLQFDPDLVVLGYCINDIGVASGNINYIRRVEKYSSGLYHSRLVQFIQVLLDRITQKQYLEEANEETSFAETYKSYMANISSDTELYEKMRLLREQLQMEDRKLPYARDYTDENRLRRLRFAFNQLHELRYRDGDRRFEVMLVYFPFLIRENVRPEIFKLISDIVQHEATRLDFRTLNLETVFEPVGYRQLLIKPDDGIHPNVQGHRLTAEALFSAIVIP